MVTGRTQIQLYFTRKRLTTGYSFDTTIHISIALKFLRDVRYVIIKCKCTFQDGRKVLKMLGLKYVVHFKDPVIHWQI